MPTLRPYQEQAVTEIFEAWQTLTSVLLVLNTGLGKTVCFAKVAEQFRPQGRILVLAHREELLDQAADKIKAWTSLTTGIEQADRHVNRLLPPDVTIASVQSLSQPHRLGQFDPKAYALIIVDEAHHCPAASFQAILAHFQYKKLLGCTATPDRLDKQALGRIFEKVVCPIDLRQAIDEGFLVPIRQKFVQVESLDFSKVRTTAGDLNEGDLESLMMQSRNLAEVAEWTVKLAEDRPTLVFGTTVKHAHALAAMLNEHKPQSAIAIDGSYDSFRRAQTFQQFIAGEKQYLCNVGIVTEGIDIPKISCVSMARPTKSRALYAQCLDAQTEILTELGWKGIDDSLEGIRVAAFDLSTNAVIWNHARRIERQLGTEAMYGIASPHLDIRVTAGHNMVMSPRSSEAWRFKTAETLPSDFRIPISGFQKQKDAGISDSDVTFLGLLLTDGCVSKANQQITFTQCEKHPTVMSLIEQTIVNCGFKMGKSAPITEPTNCGIRSPLHRWTVSFGRPRGRDTHLTGWGRLSPWISGEKSLTPAYETLSRRQVQLLVEAMQAGNGVKHLPKTWTKHTYDITIANRTLADQIQSLLVRRGFRCNQAPTISKAALLHISNEAWWSIRTRTTDNRPVWSRLDASPMERVWCVQVETGAIVTRRKGKVAIVGNCVGRSLRPHPESAKQDALILDYVGNAGRHQLISTLDIFDGNMDPEVRARAETLCEKDEGLSTKEALDQAQASLEEETRRRMLAKVRTHVTVVDINPFDLLGVRPRAGRWGGQEMTAKQQAFLERNGIPWHGLDKGQASQVIDKIVGRMDRKLCTVKMAKVLARYGLDPEVPFDIARKQLDLIAKAQWQVTEGLRQELQSLAA